MFKLALISLSILIFSSCNYSKKIGDDNSTQPTSELNTMALENNYQKINELVIKPKCLTCHADATGNRGGLNLESYSNIKKNLNQIIYRVVEAQDMPANGLKGRQFDLIKLWLESGAPENNTQTQSPIQITGPLSWSVINEKILQQKCLMCHTASTDPEKQPEGKLSFDTLESFKLNADKIFKAIYVDQTMPPADFFDSLTYSEKQALMKWISQGFND